METGEKKHPNYMGVWVALAALTIIEVGVAFISSLSKTAIILILIGLAVWKAMLVAMYYMHLKFEPPRLIVMVVAPLPLAVIFVVAVLAERF